MRGFIFTMKTIKIKQVNWNSVVLRPSGMKVGKKIAISVMPV